MGSPGGVTSEINFNSHPREGGDIQDAEGDYQD